MSEVLAYFAATTGHSFVSQGSADSELVTMRIVDQPIDVVVDVLARRLNLGWRREGQLFFVGQRREGDGSMLVRKVRGYTKTQIQEVLSAAQIEKSTVLVDGLVVITENPERIEKIDRMLTDVENSRKNLWSVKIFIVSMSDKDALEFGLDARPALDAALTYASASNAGFGLEVAGSFQAILQAVDEKSSVNTVAQPSFLMLDGETGTYDGLTSFPVQRSVVSETGIVNNAGVEYHDAGTQISVGLREVAERACRLDVRVEISQPTTFNDLGLPTIESRVYENPCVCVDRGIYLLTSIDISSSKKGRSTLLRFGREVEQTREVLQVFAQVNRLEPFQDFGEKADE